MVWTQQLRCKVTSSTMLMLSRAEETKWSRKQCQFSFDGWQGTPIDQESDSQHLVVGALFVPIPAGGILAWNDLYSWSSA